MRHFVLHWNDERLGSIKGLPADADAELIEPANVTNIDGEPCPVCGAPEYVPPWLESATIDVELHSTHFPDYISHYPEWFTDAAVQWASKAGITGLRFGCEARVRRTIFRGSGTNAATGTPRYRQLRIVRDGTRFDSALAGVEFSRTPSCAFCLKDTVKTRVDHLVIHRPVSGACDVFEPWGLHAMTMCTARFKDGWIEAGLRGLDFVPLEHACIRSGILGIRDSPPHSAGPRE